MKAKNIFSFLFLFAGGWTVVEFCLLRGMFAWLVLMSAVCALGIINFLWELHDGLWNYALLYLLACAGLCMGYFALA